MNKHTAYCGINCTTCPLYIATTTNDDSMKETLMAKWGKLYNHSFDIKEMECYGCKSNVKFYKCKNCNITACNISNGIETCTKCTNHPCERINKFYEWQKINDTKVDYI